MVLDVGEDRGALVVWMPPSLDGAEIEVRPTGGRWRGDHTSVRGRDLGAGRRFAAVFGSLVAGAYQLRVRGTTTGPLAGAEVVGGTVTELNWPVPGRGPAARWSGGTWARPRR